jgi:type I restriction enzyme S subunit
MELTATKHKQTEVGLIPEDWNVKSLGDIGEVKMCKRIFNYQTKDNGDIPFYKIGTFGKEPDAFISREIYNEFRNKYSFPTVGSVLISAAGTIGRLVVFDGTDSYFQDSNIIWIENNNQVISNEYLRHSFPNVRFQTEGGTIKRLYNNILKSGLFPCPPNEVEQKAIAQVLSDTDALIQALEKKIAKKKLIKKGVMQKLLMPKKDWEVKTLGEVGEGIIGLTYSPNDVRKNGTLVLRSSNVQKGQLAFADNVFVEMDLPDRVIVKENDILICVRNGSKRLIGKCALIDKKTAGSAFGAFMTVYRSQYSKYIFYVFQSHYIQRQIDEVMGATINQITNKDLNSFVIPFPPVEEQNKIAQILSDLDVEIQHLIQKSAKYKLAKQGLMQQLLTGKIRLV